MHKGKARKVLGVTRRKGKQESWIKEQTEVEDIFVIKKKKGTRAFHMCRTDNRWITKVTVATQELKMSVATENKVVGIDQGIC